MRCPNYKTSNSFDKVRKIVNETTRELFLGSSDLEIEETTLVSLFLEVYKSNQNKGIYKVNNTYGSIISKPLEKLKIKFINLYNDVVSKIQKYKLENSKSNNKN